MSERKASNTDAVEIYVPLLNEGTDVVRPTKGIPLGGMKYQVLPTPNYSALFEEWEFPPGSIVECRMVQREGEHVLVAQNRVSA
jgi:hypothetical protein